MDTHDYCAPVFITDEFGISFHDSDELISNDSKYPTIRNGTVTFVQFTNKFFALTCDHVLTALKKAQQQWKAEQKEKYRLNPSVEGIYFFIPKENSQYHFCYEFTTVTTDDDNTKIDIAIARINPFIMERLERKPISLNNSVPETSVLATAAGYPEIQRAEYTNSNGIARTFSPKFVTCTAALDITASGKIHLQDSIKEHNGLNNLSGMSGGPIICSENNSPALVGIVTDASDIQPVDGGFCTENAINIIGEKITPNIFKSWIELIPDKKMLRDLSKTLYIPNSFKG